MCECVEIYLIYIRVRASEAERSKLKWENLKVEYENLVFRFPFSPFAFHLSPFTFPFSPFTFHLLYVHCYVAETIAFEHVVECALCLFQVLEILHSLL